MQVDAPLTDAERAAVSRLLAEARRVARRLRVIGTRRGPAGRLFLVLRFRDDDAGSTARALIRAALRIEAETGAYVHPERGEPRAAPDLYGIPAETRQRLLVRGLLVNLVRGAVGLSPASIRGLEPPTVEGKAAQAWDVVRLLTGLIVLVALAIGAFKLLVR